MSRQLRQSLKALFDVADLSKLTLGNHDTDRHDTDSHDTDSHDTDSHEALAHFQKGLAQGRELLVEYHLERGDSARFCQYHAQVIDQLLIHAWEMFFEKAKFFEKIETARAPSLIAVGGYGRNELNLESDIDILILMLEPAAPGLNAAVSQFVRFCWDMGLKIGHSTRTLKACLEIAAQDLSVITNLMEARLVHGDQAQFDQFQAKIRSNSIWPVDHYFKAKLAEQNARHLHYGDTAYNLEPNIKESPGGLRDLHTISWVANRYFGTSDFSELKEHGFLTTEEFRALIRGRDFLMKLRNGLHLIARRCEDRLLLDFQRTLAEQLGYTQSQTSLAVEQMMQQYYRVAREIQLLNEITLQHFEEAILSKRTPAHLLKTKKINAHFQSSGNHLETINADVFAKNPASMLEMFLVLQKHPNLTGVRASTVRALRQNLPLINAQYRKDPLNRATFLAIFVQQTGLTHALRRMHKYGVLGRFFPAFGKIVGQMQHDLFHIYTVDAHSLFVVRNLRRLMVPEYVNECPDLSELLSKLHSRTRLFLAALMHDLGKGSGRDHSEVGEEIALSFCVQLGLSEYDAKFVAWLVRNHLVMSWTAQKQDTSDPRVINRFAVIVGDQEHLDNLYLLTVADIKGTSHKVWNEWKGQLLNNLYTATSRQLRAGGATANEISERINDRKRAIKKMLGAAVPEARIDKLWEQMKDEYFLRNGPETCAWHTVQICNASLIDLPVVAIRYLAEINAEQILVVAPESYQLLLRCTAIIDSLGLSILDARIHLTKMAVAILVFIVAVEDAAALQGAVSQKHPSEPIKRQIDAIRQFLLTPPSHYKPISRNISRAMQQFSVPTHVSFSEHDSNEHTIMEIVSQDRPGLLYLVACALVKSNIKLKSAKISTVGEKAEDTFFITDRDGNPVNDPHKRKKLAKMITEYLKTND